MFKSNKVYLLLTFILFGFIFFHLSRQMLQVKSDGWYVGQVNLYGDLVFHIGFINKFLESDKIIVSSPTFSGDKPNYPIFADFITAQIAKITGIDSSLFIVTFMLGLIVIFTARTFIFQFIKSDKIVFLTLLLFFVNGGFGFIYFFDDFFKSQNSLYDFFLHMPNEYTDIKEKGYWWINSYLAYFLPQRGFLFAFPITLTVLGLLYKGAKSLNYKLYILAGILAGFLPTIQAYSLFVIFIISAILAPISVFFSKRKAKVLSHWIIFAVITSLLAIPLFKTISSSSDPLKFIKFDPGWTSKENILWFWLKNLGLFGPILIWSLIWLSKTSRHLLLLYFPFLVIFIISNVFIFQPWEFDNSKLLIYWFFASCIIVAYFLKVNFFAEGLLKKVLGISIVFLMILAGGLDLFRTFTPVTNYRIFSKQDLEIAASVKNLTPKEAIFLTSSDHNHPIPALTGRATVLSFHGWAWSHGLDYRQKSQDVTTIFMGGQEASDLIKNYKISYITLGPLERKSFSINESYFANFPIIYLTGGWVLYDVSYLWSDGNRQN